MILDGISFLYNWMDKSRVSRMCAKRFSIAGHTAPVYVCRVYFFCVCEIHNFGVSEVEVQPFCFCLDSTLTIFPLSDEIMVSRHLCWELRIILSAMLRLDAVSEPLGVYAGRVRLAVKVVWETKNSNKYGDTDQIWYHGETDMECNRNHIKAYVKDAPE